MNTCNIQNDIYYYTKLLLTNIFMKKFTGILVCMFLCVASVGAYDLTSSDHVVLNKIYKILDNIKGSSREAVINQISEKAKTSTNEKQKALLDTIVWKYSNNSSSTGSIYKVLEVVDWDTIKINYDWKETSVRILGLDTPEKYATRTWYKECYWDDASNFAKSILEGKNVRVEIDSTQDKFDKYNRLLAHIFLEDWTYYEAKMIQEGYGFYYFYSKATKYDNELKKSQETAKKNNVWVWKYCDGKRIPLKTVTDTKTKVEDILKWTTNTWSTTTANKPVTNTNFSCSVKKTTCWVMKTCEEAKFYLKSCSISSLDKDKDWTPCESLCK